jgi:hypothetical protein
MSKLLNAAFATTLGFALTAPSLAADTSPPSQTTRSAAWSDMQIHDAMEQCKNLEATARAQCIVNIRPTPARESVAATPGSPPKADTVQDRAGQTDAEYAAALKECESLNAADKERCVNSAKERFGRM